MRIEFEKIVADERKYLLEEKVVDHKIFELRMKFMVLDHSTRGK